MGNIERIYLEDSPTQWGFIDRFGNFGLSGKHRPTHSNVTQVYLVVGNPMYAPGRLDSVATIKAIQRRYFRGTA